MKTVCVLVTGIFYVREFNSHGLFLGYDSEYGLYGYGQKKSSPRIFLLLSKRKIHSDTMTMPVQDSCVWLLRGVSARHGVLLCRPILTATNTLLLIEDILNQSNRGKILVMLFTFI